MLDFFESGLIETDKTTALNHTDLGDSALCVDLKLETDGATAASLLPRKPQIRQPPASGMTDV